jgi:hypothetical protein
VLSREPVRLVAPAGDDPETARWVEVPAGKKVRTRVEGERVEPGDVVVATYAEEAVRLLFHPETKMLGPDGDVCRATTRGLLSPRPVDAAAAHIVGREGNRIDEAATGEVIDPDEVLMDYGDDARERLLVSAAKLIGIRRPHRETGITLSQVADLVNGHALPRGETRRRMVDAIAGWATGQLEYAHAASDVRALVVLARFIALDSMRLSLHRMLAAGSVRRDPRSITAPRREKS